MTIKQEGTYAEYHRKFEIYSAPLPNLEETVLVTVFLNGLRPSLKAAVVSRRPVGLDQCMLEAQSIDDRDLAFKLALEEVGLSVADKKRGKAQGRSRKMEGKGRVGYSPPGDHIRKRNLGPEVGNASATFQSLMNEIFKPFLRRFILVFFDDIIVYSKDISTHESHLAVVFNVLREHRLFANCQKCIFSQPRI